MIGSEKKNYGEFPILEGMKQPVKGIPLLKRRVD
jgi:hypothetical protein